MSPAEETLLDKYLEGPGHVLKLGQDSSWLEKEISESGFALKRIFQTIYRALPTLNGTLAYSIIQPDNFVADYVIQRFEQKGQMLKVLDLDRTHLMGLRAFLALLHQENRKNVETRKLLMMTNLDKRRYLVVLDDAENISEQVLRWVLDQTGSKQEKQGELKRSNYWPLIRDDIKFKNILFKINKFPFEYAKQKIVHVPSELDIDAH